MKPEIRIFLVTGTFFGLSAVAYGLATYYAGSTGLEPVGFAALIMVTLLSYMIAGYLWATARRIDARPEDDPYGEIAQGEGDQGSFAPWSWWPLVIASAAAIAFLGLAIGWWLVGIGAVFGIIGLVGWVFEFSRGQHAH